MRDSELAVIVEDEHKVEIKLGGKNFKARKFAHTLRMKCFKQLFGFTMDLDVKDPCDPYMWEIITERMAVSSA